MDGEAPIDSDWPIRTTWTAYMDNYFVDLMVNNDQCMTGCSAGYSEMAEDDPKQITLVTNNADRATRTSWKPHMDRHFIDLMLDQVRKGNRCSTGCPGFTKDAWIQMASLMRDKFPIECDKNSLKKRVRILKNKYITVKGLLECDGFSWDETREMVIANDYLWDEYIKVHNDARAYKTKSVPYNDLSAIFSRDIIVDGRYSRSSHATCRKDDSSGFERKKIENEVPSSNDKGKKTSWTPPMDRYFIDLLLEQVHRGSWCDATYAGFPKAGWRNLAALMRRKFSIEFAKSTLQNRVKTYRKHYDAVKALLSLGSFHWDEAHQMVIAEDDVWEEYIKSHNDARIYRYKSVPHYSDFCVIFSRDGIKGRFNSLDDVINFVDVVPRLEGGAEVGQSSMALPNVLYDRSLRPLNVVGDTDTPVQHNKHYYVPPIASVSLKKVKKTTDERMADAMTAIAVAVSRIVDKNLVIDKSSSVERWIDALREVPGLDRGIFLDACDFLEDKRRIDVFLAFDAEERRMWLMRQLRQ